MRRGMSNLFSLVSITEVDRLRPVELAALTAPPGSKGNGDDLDEFYSRFEKIKDFHRQHRNINARGFIHELDDLVNGDGLETVYVDDESEPIVVDCKFPPFSYIPSRR